MPYSAFRPPASAEQWVVLGAAAAVGICIAAAVALWAHYGTAVFFEMIHAGLATCF
jgi:hypothetical protein